MIALDTNLLVRFYMEPKDSEAEKQRPIVARMMHDTANMFVSVSVLLELEWVLRGAYKFGMDEIAFVLEHLVGLDNVTTENEGAVLEAIRNYKHGMDFADALHLASASRCASLATFDKKFIRRADKLGLKPPVIGAAAKT
ncbi:MAG: type II toxin-antitoxin system VapC family toxin [Nitrosomonadales bacterium]|nr:type II toxin-antitoxin system VapC family toxin [Nitrosomonadales bacterium]